MGNFLSIIRPSLAIAVQVFWTPPFQSGAWFPEVVRLLHVLLSPCFRGKFVCQRSASHRTSLVILVSPVGNLESQTLSFVLSSHRGLRGGNGCTIIWFSAVRVLSPRRLGIFPIGGSMKDSIFLSGGFSNWKDATVRFVKHEQTTTHKITVDLVVTLPRTTRDVGKMLSSAHAVEKAANRHCLLKTAESIRFLARQGLPLHGNSKW